jgi:hypothetical protein
MKQRVAPALCLTLAILCIFAWGRTARSTPAEAVWRQGAFRILLEAEGELRDGRPEQALSRFRTAALRAQRSGAQGAFQRIRSRVASAGREQARANLGAAWPLLEWYALTDADFFAGARGVEQWILGSLPKPPATFTYELMRRDGRKNFLGERPSVGPLALYRLWPPNRDLRASVGRLYYILPPDLPAQGSRLLHTYLPLQGIQPSPFGTFEVYLQEKRAAGQLFLSAGEHVQWRQPHTAMGSGPSVSVILPAGAFPFRRLVWTGDGPLPRLSARVVRSYTSLP